MRFKQFEKHAEIVGFTFLFTEFYLLNHKIVVEIVLLLIFRKNFEIYSKQKATVDFITLWSHFNKFLSLYFYKNR